MQFSEKTVRVSTPGRICLFGEHQDYLQLPVIAAAISRRVCIVGSRRTDRKVNIDLPDVRKRESFEISKQIRYVRERDYFRSAVNVLQRRGFEFSYGFDCTVKGNIPINAGMGSSSALTVCWVDFLSRLTDQQKELEPQEIAQIAHEAEVLEFSEPGGSMDHYSAAKGGVIWLESYPATRMSPMNVELKSFVVGNSNQPKDTKSVLANVKNKLLAIVNSVRKRHPGFSLQTVSRNELDAWREEMRAEQFELLAGTVRNRDISFEARKVLEHSPLDHKRFGELLDRHHAVLRDVLKISTPKIDRMIDAALNAGAYGGKINGSGGGGCMVAYAPENPDAVMEAVRTIGEASIVSIGEGSRLEENTPEL